MQRMGSDNFKAELQYAIVEAVQESQAYETAVQRQEAEQQQQLLGLVQLVRMRFQEAVQVGQHNLEYKGPPVRAPGNQRSTLAWIGPGVKRALHVDIDLDEVTLQWAWEAPWNADGYVSPVERARFATFGSTLEKLIFQLVRPAPWLRGQFPNPVAPNPVGSR